MATVNLVSTCLGDAIGAMRVGRGSKTCTYNSTASSTALGVNAYAGPDGLAVGFCSRAGSGMFGRATAIGSRAGADYLGTAVGIGATACLRSVAIGAGAGSPSNSISIQAGNACDGHGFTKLALVHGGHCHDQDSVLAIDLGTCHLCVRRDALMTVLRGSGSVSSVHRFSHNGGDPDDLVFGTARDVDVCSGGAGVGVGLEVSIAGHSVAIGHGTLGRAGGVAIGYQSEVNSGGVAIGAGARACDSAPILIQSVDGLCSGAKVVNMLYMGGTGQGASVTFTLGGCTESLTRAQFMAMLRAAKTS